MLPWQVDLYFPEQSHPRYGVMRAAVKDSPDSGLNSSLDSGLNSSLGASSLNSSLGPSSLNSSQEIFLDSDGLIGNNVLPAFQNSLLQNASFLFDGGWHMATITTQPDATTGFLLYVDGQLAGDMAQGTYPGKQQSPHCLKTKNCRSSVRKAQALIGTGLA